MQVTGFRFRPSFFALLLILLLQLLGCNYSAPKNTGPAGTQTVNGTVAAVLLTSVTNGAGGTNPATSVTLTVPLGTNSLVLCGDQRSSFTLNSSVQVAYTNGTYCQNLVSVTPM
jgi:hypothetical protein